MLLEGNLKLNHVNENKFQIQHSQYVFPYHYIPSFNSDGVPSISRKLNWGLEYLCYQRHLHERVIELKPNSVLEVGCGDGYFLGGLPNTINRRIGVDLSDKAIGFAKAFHPHCDFRVENVDNLNEHFDVVAVIEVLEHIPDDSVSEFLRSLAGKVKDSGAVIISVPTTVLPLNKKHYRHYTKKILLDQLESSECGLIIDRVEYVYTDPWWFRAFSRFFDNKIFSFEFKPFMSYAWKSIWNNYRIVNESNGFHLVAYLRKASRGY